MKLSLFAINSVIAVSFASASDPLWCDEAAPAIGAAPETVPPWYVPVPSEPAWNTGSWEPIPPEAPGQARPVAAAGCYQLQVECEADRIELYSLQQELYTTEVLLEHAQAALERSYADYQQALAEQRLLREQLAAVTAEHDTARTRAMQMKAELEAAKATLAQNREQLASGQTLALSLTEEGAQLRSQLTDRGRQLASVRTQLQSATAALSRAHTEQVALREELSSARSETAASCSELATVQSQYQACHAQLVDLDAELEHVNKDKLRARESLAEAVAARDALARALSAREAELAETEAAATVARDEAEQLRLTTDGAAGDLAAQRSGDDVAMTSVETLSASADAGRDVVSDGLERCPETGKGVTVGATGCGVEAGTTLEGVGFSYDSHELTDESYAVLDHVAMILEQHPGLKVEVAGHADAQGDAAYNQWLSEQRAKTVRDYLVTQGVNGDNLTARGYGVKEPVADNSTWEGLVQNRRVELRRLP